MYFKSLLVFTILLILNLQAGIGEGQSATGPLPVELTSFSASIQGASTGSATSVVLLNWTTATEVNNYGFEIFRSTRNDDASTPLSMRWKEIGFVEGHGNSNSPKEYSFVDTSTPLSASIVSYRLKQIDTDGTFKYSEIVEIIPILSKEFVLQQNYPNPFNPTTVISYSIPTSSFVSVKVFDVLGNTIATLVNKKQVMGSYKVNFNAKKLSNGIYFYKISADKFISVKKMLLLK